MLPALTVNSESDVHPCFSNLKFGSCSKHQISKCLWLSSGINSKFLRWGINSEWLRYGIGYRRIQTFNLWNQREMLTVSPSGWFPRHLLTSSDMDGRLTLTCVTGDLAESLSPPTLSCLTDPDTGLSPLGVLYIEAVLMTSLPLRVLVWLVALLCLKNISITIYPTHTHTRVVGSLAVRALGH